MTHDERIQAVQSLLATNSLSTADSAECLRLLKLRSFCRVDKQMITRLRERYAKQLEAAR